MDDTIDLYGENRTPDPEIEPIFSSSTDFAERLIELREDAHNSQIVSKLIKVSPGFHIENNFESDDSFLRSLQEQPESHFEIILQARYFEEEYLYNILTCFPRLTKLKVLIINWTNLGQPLFYESFCYVLKQLKSIEVLSLPKCGLKENLHHLSNSLGSLVNLIELNLSDNDFTYRDIIALLSYKPNKHLFMKLPNIKYLNLNCSYEKKSTTNLTFDIFRNNEIISCLGSLRLLSEVYLSNMSLSGSMKSLAFMMNRVNLRVLDVSFNHLNVKDVKTLCKHWTHDLCGGNNGILKLEQLYLSNNHIGNEGYKELITNLHRFKALKVLDLAENQIEKLNFHPQPTEIIISPTFESLNLSGNDLNNLSSGKQFKENYDELLKVFPMLKQRIMISCNLNSDTLIYILNSAKNLQNLDELSFDLRENLFGDNDKKTLKKYEKLLSSFKSFFLNQSQNSKFNKFIKHCKYHEKLYKS